MIEQKDKECNSQFLEDCNTDWNLNHEFICWLNYWCKEYLKNAGNMVDLSYHKFEYKDEELSQKEIIERIIELTEKIHTHYYDYDSNEYEELDKDVDEVFILFRLVFWCMWW